jgi:hypothetical protein
MKIPARPMKTVKSPIGAVTRSLKMSMIGHCTRGFQWTVRPVCVITRLALADGVNEDCEGVGEIMIGPPGLPKYGRRVFAFAAPKRSRSRQHQHAWKWVTGLYLAGVLAHFSHHMVGLPNGSNPSSEALTSAPLSLVWPADLIETLITLG